MKTQLKTLRKSLHNLLQSVAHINIQTDTGVYNTTAAWHSLRMARGWLGKALGAIGEENPYPVAATPDKIPPTADTPAVTPVYKQLETTEQYLAAINQAREKTKEKIVEIEQLTEQYQSESNSTIRVLDCLQLSWQHLHEASMNLGYQLQHLHEQSKEAEDTQP